jgi:hypothetical protein
MDYDFSSVEDDRDEFVLVPEGVYEVRIAEARESRGRDGREHWGLRLEVLSGDWAGKTAAWDWLVWSERGVPRIKRIFRALGIDVGGTVSIHTHELIGLKARVMVGVEEREDPLTGRSTLRNRVPYDGYAPLEEEADTPGSNGTADFALS